MPAIGQLSSRNLTSNMYVSMSSNGLLGIFLNNVSDDPEPPNLENMRFFKKGHYSLTLFPSGDERILSDCVRVEISGKSNPKIVASIIELMIEENKTPYSYSDLLLAIDKFRKLFKGPSMRLTDEELKGLWGELWFLKEVIFRCRSREEMEQCLNSWKGSEIAKRDFRFPDSKIIFEIKTTEKKSREHEISSADQLTLKKGESAAYLVSIGVRREDAGAAHTIESLCNNICKKVDDKLLEEKLINLLKERKWTTEAHQDISLIVSTGLPMSLFPFNTIPTILPLPDGVYDANWTVNLSDSQNIPPKESELIYSKSIQITT